MKQVSKPKKKAIMLTLSEKIWPLSRVLYSFTVTGGSLPWLSALLFLRMSEVYREFEAKIMEIKVEHDFLKFEALTGLWFSPWGVFLGICCGSMPSGSPNPTPFQTNAYKANLRVCPPPGDFLRQKINTIKIRIRIQKTRTTKTGTLRSSSHSLTGKRAWISGNFREPKASSGASNSNLLVQA